MPHYLLVFYFVSMVGWFDMTNIMSTYRMLKAIDYQIMKSFEDQILKYDKK